MCYKYVSQRREWSNSLQNCENESANPTVNLASIHDDNTNDFLKVLTNENAWIGGSRDESGSWNWSDGSQWTGYENWHEGQLNPGPKEDFILVNHPIVGEWSNVINNVSYIQGSLCQYDPEPCESGWAFSEHTNLCYKLVNTKTIQPDAIKTCQEAISNPSANLASIPDRDTNLFLARLNFKISSWIGASKSSEGDWVWSDGRQWNYTNWATDDEPSNGDQIVFNWPGLSSGQWTNVPIVDHLLPALCQYDAKGKKKVITTTKIATTPTMLTTPMTSTSTTSPNLSNSGEKLPTESQHESEILQSNILN